MKIRKAVIPAAGLGTRLLPATKAQAKEMLPIVDKPALQFVVEEAASSGIEDILIITNRNKENIENHFDRSYALEAELAQKQQEALRHEIRKISEMANIYFIRQKSAMGLGHALSCARSFVGFEPFAVMLPDDIMFGDTPALSQLIEVYHDTRYSVLGVERIPPSQTSRYGLVVPQGEFDERGVCRIDSLVEKPAPADAPSDLAIIGRYILTPNIFDILAHTPKGAGGEIQLTDALHTLCKSDDIYACLLDSCHYDMGNRLAYLRAVVELGMQHTEVGAAFAEYLAELSLDNGQPLYSAIREKLKQRREQKDTP